MFCYVKRMDGTRILINTFELKFKGKRPMGWPSTWTFSHVLEASWKQERVGKKIKEKDREHLLINLHKMEMMLKVVVEKEENNQEKRTLQHITIKWMEWLQFTLSIYLTSKIWINHILRYLCRKSRSTLQFVYTHLQTPVPCKLPQHFVQSQLYLVFCQ